ncbi:hypothetical protein Daesc_005553 [Daldinia eschscholtzii]|uniref:Nephrocystin 3-like N-terminal domain-containing protein n=1 Tax=Daldinia eschscholtzii TaxID=292717 RepID=A0AAX6MM49_9PEZI
MSGLSSISSEYEIVDHEETALSPEEIEKIRNWLNPTDYLAESGEFRRNLSCQAPGTGLWITQTHEYRKWHDSSEHGSLWVKGVPGAGKSVMAATVIQRLRTSENCPVLFFFFRNIVAANFSPRSLIRDWLAQLLPYSPKLQVSLRQRLQTSLEETSDNELFQSFLDGVSSVPKCFCIADALDEMDEKDTGNRPLLDKLNSLATYRPQSLKLLITSRPKQYLQSALRDASIVHISLQKRLVDADIAAYLHHRFDRLPRNEETRGIKQQVIDMAAKMSQGLFLVAKLTMDQVETFLLAEGPVNIHALEQSLPIGLEQTYTSLLAKQRDENGVTLETQAFVLEAVTHSSRPLRLNELASLMECVSPGIEPPAGFKTLVATCCAPLVEILEDETLQVIHHSFTEFLRGETRSLETVDAKDAFPVIDFERTHQHMAINCLRYLQSGSLLLESENSDDVAVELSITYQKPQHQIDPDKEYNERQRTGSKKQGDPFRYSEARLRHPFLSYAVENWAYHASLCGKLEDEELFTAVLGFLKPYDIAFRRWLVLQWGTTSNGPQDTEGLPTALHIAAFAGLCRLSLKLIKQGLDVSVLDAQERIPLHWAAFNGHAKLALLLIQHGSDPNAADGRGLKPIHLAAQNNHAEVVKVLLEAGVEPDTIKSKEDHAGLLLGGETITMGECAILYACKRGHTQVIIAMIPFCKPETLERLLCISCEFGRTDAVLAILEKTNVSANATYCGATALYLACKSTNVKCAKALIDRGAHVTKTSKWRPRLTRNGVSHGKGIAEAPIHSLAKSWLVYNDSSCRAILRLLIGAGADLEQPDSVNQTAIIKAAGLLPRNRRTLIPLPCVKALAEAGADLKKTNPEGDTVMNMILREHRDPELIRHLLKYGSDPNQKGKHGYTALHCALEEPVILMGRENVEAVIKILLDNGADPDIPDDRGTTPMYKVISSALEVSKILLKNCKNNGLKRSCWFSLSSQSNIEKFTKCLEMLLADGIDINITDDKGRSLYLRCWNSENKLQILRDHGAKADCTDNHGNNLLHMLASQHGWTHERLQKRIAEDGLDPLKRNDFGDTLLHLAASWYTGEQKDVDYVRWLISIGIPINAVNNKDRTAFHNFIVADSYGRTDRPKKLVHFVDAVNYQNDVDFEIRDNGGNTVLHLAAIRSEAHVKALIDAGASPNALTKNWQNILHLSCQARKPNIVCQILRLGTVNINQRDCFGGTPLHYACRSGEPESVALLLSYGADLKMPDFDHSTPLHACAQFRLEQSMWNAYDPLEGWIDPARDTFRPRSRTSVQPWYRTLYCEGPIKIMNSPPDAGTTVRLLLDAGCNIAAVDKFSLTALDVALHLGSSEFVEIFAKDEDLFKKATQNLDRKESRDRAERIRERMKAHIDLVKPRSALSILDKDTSTYTMVTESIYTYLDLLTYEDAAQLINEGFESDPLNISHYELVRELMKPGHTQVAGQVSRLILHYSSYTSLRDMIERQRKAKACRYIWNAETALEIACRQHEPNILTLKLLVEKLQVDINARGAYIDRYEDEEDLHAIGTIPAGTALHALAPADHSWQLEGMKYLLSHGAFVDALNERGETPLHITACSGGLWKLEVARLLLDHGANPNMLDNANLSPLHKASTAPEVMKELLVRGADTTIGDKKPLFLAIRDQSLLALETLLDNGLSVDSLDESCHSQEVDYTLKKPRKVYALLSAAFASRVNTRIDDSVPLLRTLVRRGANLYLPLNDDETMIHFLFEYPEYEVLDALLQEPCASRIDFNRRDQRGRTVLIASCDWRHILPGYSYRRWFPKAVGPPLRILDYGADATAVDNEGKTALHHLLDNTSMPDEVIIQFINRAEVAPTLLLKDNDGFSTLHYASRVLRPDICNVLLAKGADILEPDPNGLSIIHHIASQCLEGRRKPLSSKHNPIDLPDDYFDKCLALWQRYIAKGGSINAVDKDGSTPLHTFLSSATINSRVSSTGEHYLRRFEKLFPANSGVDLSAQNGQGETALHLIAKRSKDFYEDEDHDKVMFEAFVAKGVDPLKEDAKGRSALDVASAFEKDHIIAIFGRK